MTVWAVVAGYLAIGVLVALVGPGRRELATQVASARGTSVSAGVLEPTGGVGVEASVVFGCCSRS